MSEQPSPIVEFRAVEKRYGDGPLVLDRISFSAQPDDFISVIGPSGCGKTTLLRLLAGVSAVTDGELVIDGQSPEAAAQELAYVFQEPTLLPWLTVDKNVQLLLRLRGVPAVERAAVSVRALSLVRLSDKDRCYPCQLSGGQKMRVSLARALSLSPKILLLDEPFGALDEMSREHLNEELLAVRARQTWTAFFVTHSVAEAVFLSNRILVMSANPGRIHREVSVDLPYPRTPETRESAVYLQLVAEVSRLLRSVECYQP
jgi:NitT/TauT family transport system ATP-binding protein